MRTANAMFAISLKCQKGFTLVEILLGLFLALLLMQCLFHYFTISKKNWRARMTLQHVDDEVDAIFKRLRHDIQQAGYIGCAKLTADYPIYPTSQSWLTFGNKITGTADKLITRFGSTMNIAYLKSFNKNTLHLAQKIKGIHPQDRLMIAACESVELAQVKSIASRGDEEIISLGSALHYPFKANAEVSKFIIHSYYFDKIKEAIFLKSLRESNLRLSRQGMHLHFHYYYKKNNTLIYTHQTQKSDPLQGVMIRIHHVNLNKKWYAYVPL